MVFKIDGGTYVPIFEPQDDQFEEEEIIRQGGAQTVYQIRQLLGAEVRQEVMVLENQTCSHHCRPQ